MNGPPASQAGRISVRGVRLHWKPLHREWVLVMNINEIEAVQTAISEDISKRDMPDRAIWYLACAIFEVALQLAFMNAMRKSAGDGQ